MSIFGTRPEAIKMAPLVRELALRPEFESLCCVTAQHRQMLDSVLEIFHLRPDYDLNIMEPNQTLSTITSKCLMGLEGVMSQAKPDLVLVHGDTSTTFAGALAAFYQKIPVGHVEAGLRTWDRYSPFPEEMNRRLVGEIAELHFCPTASNRENLRRQGVENGAFVTGNTVIDALRTTVSKEYRFTTKLLNELDYTARKVVLVTCHRRENYGKPMASIMTALRRLADDFPETELVYPVHLSPVVQEAAAQYLSGHPRIHLIPPLDAEEMHNLMARCYLVMTDSGGLQEEAPALGKPVLVLRQETERPEAIAAGTARLAGTDEETVYAMGAVLLRGGDGYTSMARAVNPYGDGQACRRIADAIAWKFGLSHRMPEEFAP
ncbi:MAG TPA: UDP-N-acetylglucosamine 2-epimerase (non-hydrolyzing) [Candidatus Galloscillospira stercoripullorum]|nr:UDP-N-acetylglucosamine 2-epimerase (non-hydrolyzing) [Candidatus Galloscillospira stercoripullorum]